MEYLPNQLVDLRNGDSIAINDERFAQAAIIAVGDVHGELEGLRQILRHARVLGDRDQWIGGDTILVQTGDVIDRGPKSKEAYALLASLQSEAPRTGGKVIRLLGNHELALLQGRTRYANFQGTDFFRRILARDVLSGKVLAAFAGQGYLFTHAGLRPEIRKELLASEGRTTAFDQAVVLADKINRILVDAVKSGHFVHSIFNVGQSRGGRHAVGGIFWEDASEIKPCGPGGEIFQVFGHTVHKRIQISACASRVAIDVGMHYHGGRGYLALRDGKPFARDAAGHGLISAPWQALRELVTAAVRPAGVDSVNRAGVETVCELFTA